MKKHFNCNVLHVIFILYGINRTSSTTRVFVNAQEEQEGNTFQNQHYKNARNISSSQHMSSSRRYLNEDQPFQFSSSAHACLLAYDMVQCVGYNYYGQLGQDSSDTFSTPVVLNFPSSITAKPKKVVTGYDHTCTLFDDGHVWCNGSNGFQQLGNGGTVNSSTPVQVKKLGTNVDLADVIDIEAGAYHNCAIQSTGAMYCWGFDNKGQLGLNNIMDGTTNEKKAVKMALSLISSCVITGTETNPSKSATCVGKGFTSESAASTTIDLVNDIHQLTAGSHHFCALLVGDTAKCWGANNAGQLGIGSKDLSPRYNTAEDVLASPGTSILSNVADINAGYLSTCLVLANGTPMCFGNNRFYQLGIANGGANELYPKALSIAPVSGKTLVSLHVGEQTGHAIYNDDSIYSMGTNYGGTFGDGSTVISRNVIGDISGAITRQMEFSIGTNSPSNIPSLQPSSSPSLLPSDTPSLQPSSSPSLLPSDAPSLLHSSEPSKTPSLQPSSSPSLLPSDIPSLQPSSSPSSSPSDLPSLSPSSNPSQDPYLLGDENSHITFNNVDFGSTNSVKGIKITYANGEVNSSGSVEVKLGDASGTTIAQFTPVGTNTWVDVSNIMLIPFDSTVHLSGINLLTFTTSETTAAIYLISYELIDLSERYTPFTTIDASEVSTSSGVVAGDGNTIGSFDNGDFFTYSPVDFGTGSNSIKITYGTGTSGASFEIRKGDHLTGEIIGTYTPATTGGWSSFTTVEIPIKTSYGIDQLTFKGTYRSGIMNLKSFQLSPVTAGYICLDSTTRTNTASVQAAASLQKGANLVSIRCSAQQSLVASMPITGGTWIGGTDAVNEGTWVLPDGNAMTYFNWNTGEPNNAGGNEDCIVMATSGKWVDGPCNSGATTRPAFFESTFAINGLTCNDYVDCQDTVQIVENGVQTSDTRLRNNNLVTQSDTAGAYLSVPGSATATHADNWNVYNLPIGANDDFSVRAKLKVDGTGSAAGFIINNGDLFGFNGSANSNGIFGEGTFSGIGPTNYGTHSDNLFYLKVERKLGTIKFYINEQEVASFANYNVVVSKFSWRPWRAELKIYDFTVSGPSLLYFGFSSVFNGYSFLIDAANTNSYTWSGTVVNDLIVGINGQLAGSTSFDSSSVKSFVFNGSTDYIQFGDTGISLTSATFTCWVKRNGADGDYTGLIISRPNSSATGQNCVGIGIMSNGNIWYFWNSVGSTHDSGLSVPVGEWAMITVTIGAGVVKFYRNVAQGTSHTYDNSLTTLTNLVIGDDIYFSSQRFFNGQIATVAIYNRALSDSEVTQLYNDSNARYQ